MPVKTEPCKLCGGSGWVCEIHTTKPFEHKLIRWFGYKDCGGAGMPCKCNTYNPPWNYPDETRIEIKKKGK